MAILRWAAFFGLMGIVLGAFAAHGLESELSPEQINSFETGVRYQFWHALALLILGTSGKNLRYFKGIFYCWVIGVVFFSGSIFLLSTSTLIGISFQWLWPITPLGGLFMIIGWALLLASTFRRKPETAI